MLSIDPCGLPLNWILLLADSGNREKRTEEWHVEGWQLAIIYVEYLIGHLNTTTVKVLLNSGASASIIQYNM
jgi:hypothetical protein